MRYEPMADTTRDPDELAIERYRYLLRTAPPEALERAHEAAFERLTPTQRRLVFERLAREADPAETRGMTDAPRDLARLATRSELGRPGTIERASGGHGSSGGFLTMVAGAFMGTAIANAMFGGFSGLGGESPGAEAAAAPGAETDFGGRAFGGTWADADSASADGGPDVGAGPDLGSDAGLDFGGDFGDLGGF